MKELKDTTREELALGLDDLAKVLPSFGGFIREAAARLRDSVDRRAVIETPNVCVEETYNSGLDRLFYRVELNGFIIATYSVEAWGSAEAASEAARVKAYLLRLALGMEGGG